jgi:hypothetical protein
MQAAAIQVQSGSPPSEVADQAFLDRLKAAVPVHKVIPEGGWKLMFMLGWITFISARI